MMSTLASRWRLLTCTSVLLLLVVVIGWRLTNSLNIENLALALAFSAPLIAPLPGLWRGKIYTFRWATLCALPYFIVGITEVVANPHSRPWSTFLLAGSLLWFFALIAYLRVAQRAGSAPA